MEWDFSAPPSPQELEDTNRLRERARKKLEANRHKLPRLTKKQADVIVEWMVDAYRAGESETADLVCHVEREQAAERSRRGVQSRRRKSKRMKIIAAFEAAAVASKDVRVDDLAKQFGVSRATAYRALAMRRASRPKR